MTRPIWHGVPCLTEEELADQRLCEQLAATDGRWIRMDLLELLVIAMTERELGYNKAALEYLDGALEIFKPEIGARKSKLGRKPLKHDPDASAVGFMEHMSKRNGETCAKKLARVALRSPRWRRADKSKISESDVKRLADKWKAQREIKSD